MKVGCRIPVIGNMNSSAVSLQTESRQWNCFSQYTDIESLLCILENREIKANCITNVDDLSEQQCLQPLIDSNEAMPYIACFDHTEDENIALWHMYSGDKYGVCIQFIRTNNTCISGFHEVFIDKQRMARGFKDGDFVDFSLINYENKNLKYPKAWIHTSTTPINYLNNSEYLKSVAYQLPANKLINWSTLVSVKSQNWSFQNEVRIVAQFDHTDYTSSNDIVDPIEVPAFEYLLLPLCFSSLKMIRIIFSPWMGKKTKEMIRGYVHSDPELKQLCKFEDSKFDGMIKRK